METSRLQDFMNNIHSQLEVEKENAFKLIIEQKVQIQKMEILLK